MSVEANSSGQVEERGGEESRVEVYEYIYVSYV